MKPLFTIALAGALALGFGSQARSAPTWTEGVNYFVVESPRISTLPKGKVEVTEVFSYACPACNVFQPTMHKLKQSLPLNAVLDYLPASFNPNEDWPMFQLAYCTAQVLGIADQSHDAMFDAVWKGGQLAVIDPSTQGIKRRLPSIEDAAKFYQERSGVPVEKFIATSKSFAVDVKVRGAEDLLQAYRIDRTPTLVVAGKYRLTVESAAAGNKDQGTPREPADRAIELVQWLVAKESR